MHKMCFCLSILVLYVLKRHSYLQPFKFHETECQVQTSQGILVYLIQAEVDNINQTALS